VTASGLEFHRLTFVDEPDGVVVGRADTQSYAMLPGDGAALLRRLTAGMPSDTAAEWYRAEFGEPVDMADFIATLRELGFVRNDSDQPTEPARLRFQRLGRLAFSPPAWLVYTALVIACVVVMVTHPEVRPHARNVFFVPSLVVVQTSLLLAQLPAVWWHEWFHVLAGRRRGLPTRLALSRRLYFVVVETHLDGLYGVPRRQRYLPFLAGMLADTLLFSVLTLAALGGSSWIARLALAVAYTIVLRLAWQFYVFLRTDLYYVLTTLLGCVNPHEATSAYLRRKLCWLPGVRPPAEDESAWSPRDRRAAPWFALLTLGGVASLLATVALAVVPVSVDLATRLGTRLVHGTPSGAQFWDSAASLFLIIVQFAAPALISPRGGAWRPRRESP
jgi:hypothetical protein